MADGPMASAVLATLARLEVDPTVDARGRLALLLAARLDSEPENPAPVARELRITVSELEAVHGDDIDAFAELLAELSPSMVDSKD